MIVSLVAGGSDRYYRYWIFWIAREQVISLVAGGGDRYYHESLFGFEPALARSLGDSCFRSR